MPRIVRPMVFDPNEPSFPRIGTTRNCLGVRTAGKIRDVDLDAAGNVAMNRQGLSVSDEWRKLPGFLIPEHLEDEHNGASGRGMRVFVHGGNTGAFAEGRVAAGLDLLFTHGSTTAGVVCPTAAVPLAQYQSDLGATRPDWVIDQS